MLAVARHYVNTRAVAEEVVQDTWLGVLKGIDRFEGRSSLRTWILRILVNTAKTRGVREARSVPIASLGPEGDEAAVEPKRFRSADDPFPGHWRAYPGNWHRLPDEVLADRETLDIVLATIHQLPPPQRAREAPRWLTTSTSAARRSSSSSTTTSSRRSSRTRRPSSSSTSTSATD